MNNESAALNGFDLVGLCVPLGYLVLTVGTLWDIYAVNGVTANASTLSYWLCLAVSYAVVGWSWQSTFRIVRSTDGHRKLVNRALVGFAVANGLLGLGSWATRETSIKTVGSTG